MSAEKEEARARVEAIESGICPGCGFGIGDAGICQDLWDGCPQCGDDLYADYQLAHAPDEEEEGD